MKLKNKRLGGWMAGVLAVALVCCGVARAESFYSGDGPAPAGMEIEWQSVGSSAGSPIKAWVREDLILIETDAHSLIAIRRSDGFHLWHCFLETAIKFTPAVSRANVLVNVNNFLIAIDKRGGNIRWKLAPDFIMCSDPVLVDPALYPSEYTFNWQNLESIYVPGWDSRMHAFWSRGKMATLIKGIRPGEDVIAPNFDFFKQWLKPNEKGAFNLFPMKAKDEYLYYSADNQRVYAVNQNGDSQEPYYMMGNPCTELTVTNSSVYIGARDTFVYCLDRLSMKKKWSYMPGKLARGMIFADDPLTPYVYVPLEDGTVHALRVIQARTGRKNEFDTPERFKEVWSTPGEGTISAGPKVVYIGVGATGDHAFKSVAAVDKETGKTLWTDSSAMQFLEYPNNWSMRNSGARLYALSADGRVISYKEKRRDTREIIAQLTKESELESGRMPMPKKAEPTGDAPKGDAPKGDAPAKPDAPKPDAAKPEEKK